MIGSGKERVKNGVKLGFYSNAAAGSVKQISLYMFIFLIKERNMLRHKGVLEQTN